MAKKPLEVRTESMFYVLMALRHGEMCGTEIVAFIDRRSGGAVPMGPGTLYALLGRFLEEGLIEELGGSGRRRDYRITPLGERAYQQELERLRRCVANAEDEPGMALPGGEEAR